MVNIEITNEDIDAIEAEHNALFTDPHKLWQFDEERRKVIRSWDDVQACPGSGKTTLVAAKLLILAKKWKESHKGICVLTHTNVARDEIVERLHNHPAGFKLTAYPHFIGTIQQFINTFLALPYLRSEEHQIGKIDDDACCQIIDKLLAYKTKKFLESKYASPYSLKLHYFNGKLLVKIPGFSKESTSCSYANLSKIKSIILEQGLFFFSEMYAFSEALLSECPEITSIIRNRFPLVLIDEMQDTQAFQDRIISGLFDHESVFLQRLGDPDQAIYDNIGEDGPNESYNGQDQPHKIRSTHRFGSDLCEKIIGLSSNRLDALLSARKPERGEHPHTIFLYKDETRDQVLEAFGNLVIGTDPDGEWKTVKAVGGVDGEKGNIRKYWSSYDKSKSASSPKPKKLIHIAYICKELTTGHVSSDYDLLMQGVLDLLRKADRKIKGIGSQDINFSRSSLNRWLRTYNKHENFRRLLSSIVLGTDLSAECWEHYVADFRQILDIHDLTAEANDYLAYDEAPEHEAAEHAISNNLYTCANGRKIEVSTIHSVKGETHDATLILETKRYQNDVQQLLPYLVDSSLKSPTSNRKIEFMRKLYVAGSRPRHLLCIAMHKDHISAKQIAQLKSGELGWKVHPLVGVDQGG